VIVATVTKMGKNAFSCMLLRCHSFFRVLERVSARASRLRTMETVGVACINAMGLNVIVGGGGGGVGVVHE
jgi:hypothetical protein